MNKICKLCGKTYHSGGQYCVSCYNYIKKHPEGVYELPPAGEVHFAPNGDAICHICGKAIRKLGSHIVQVHHISQNEYRDMFKLYHNTRLSNKEYINHMSNLNKKYKSQVVDQNLIKAGFSTRTTHERGLSGRKHQHKVVTKNVK